MKTTALLFVFLCILVHLSFAQKDTIRRDGFLIYRINGVKAYQDESWGLNSRSPKNQFGSDDRLLDSKCMNIDRLDSIFGRCFTLEQAKAISGKNLMIQMKVYSTGNILSIAYTSNEDIQLSTPQLRLFTEMLKENLHWKLKFVDPVIEPGCYILSIQGSKK